MGLRNWLFGSSSDAASESDDESEDTKDGKRPYPVETEKFSRSFDVTAVGNFTRTVELVSAINGQNTLIEYDERETSNGTTYYRAFDDVSYSPHTQIPCIRPNFGTELIEMNESNILSRKTLGSYTVHLEKDVVVEVEGASIVDPIDSIPDECLYPNGRPRTKSDYVNDIGCPNNNYVVADEGPPLAWKSPWMSTDDARVDGEVVYIHDSRVTNEIGQLSVEPEESTGDVIAESIASGTDVMRAVLSDGTVVVPDDEQALTDDGSDLMRIAELASDRKQ